MPKSSSSTPNDKDTAKYYQELGRQLAKIYNMGFADRKKAFSYAFSIGVLRGLGTVVGATVGVALLLWILSLFSEVPLIGHFLDNVQNTLNQRQP